MTTLYDFLTHQDPLVVETAEHTIQICADYQAGLLSEAEFIELLQTIVDYQKIINTTNDMHRRYAIDVAFQQIYNLATIII